MACCIKQDWHPCLKQLSNYGFSGRWPALLISALFISTKLCGANGWGAHLFTVLSHCFPTEIRALHVVAAYSNPTCLFEGSSVPRWHAGGGEGGGTEKCNVASNKQHFAYPPAPVPRSLQNGDVGGMEGAVQGAGDQHREWQSLHLAPKWRLCWVRHCMVAFSPFTLVGKVTFELKSNRMDTLMLVQQPTSFPSTNCRSHTWSNKYTNTKYVLILYNQKQGGRRYSANTFCFGFIGARQLTIKAPNCDRKGCHSA